MEYYIGNTDFEWYSYLKDHNFEEINFWSPGGMTNFKAIDVDAPFLFRLKQPISKIVGIGYFNCFSNMPFYRAWELYQNRNGYNDFLDFYSKIRSYRRADNPLEGNPNIGCILLKNPIFFNEDDWIPTPADWAKNTVRGKTYSTNNDIGNNLWSEVENVLNRHI